jgi:hypothetical protein
MNAFIKSTKLIPFHIRWLLMSEQERYAYLWGKTRKTFEFSSVRRNIMTPAHSYR